MELTSDPTSTLKNPGVAETKEPLALQSHGYGFELHYFEVPLLSDWWP